MVRMFLLLPLGRFKITKAVEDVAGKINSLLLPLGRFLFLASYPLSSTCTMLAFYSL